MERHLRARPADGSRFGAKAARRRVTPPPTSRKTTQNPLESECFVIRQSVREEPRTSYPGTQRSSAGSAHAAPQDSGTQEAS